MREANPLPYKGIQLHNLIIAGNPTRTRLILIGQLKHRIAAFNPVRKRLS